ncbi:hypothetical protein C0Q70_07707 [Pomacea canaliculata]|uniref:MADF domain-containing protein n=1 Tax=Pomacea canaliculata TaxID=400727 RepID=A0A2T7PFT0_POMCA|nr:hypothetical protein C0Q70_07707 [Pomacea canaliculata]
MQAPLLKPIKTSQPLKLVGMDLIKDEVKQKMRSLRNSFFQQLSAYNARCRSGASAQHVAEPTWHFWKALCFLRPFIKLRKGQDNLSSTSANCSQSSAELLVPEEDTGDISVLLTSVGAFTEKTAEAPAAPPSSNVYQQAPPSKAPDCAKRRRRADNLDTPSPAHQAVDILKNLQKTGKATPNEMFYQMVAGMTEKFPEHVQDQLHRDIFNMVQEVKLTLQNKN